MAIIIGLALTGYAAHLFLNIKASRHQHVAPENQPGIQWELPAMQMVSNEPAWIPMKQTATPDLPVRNPIKVRVGPNLAAVEGRADGNSGQFFIAGIIVEDQPDNVEDRTIFFNDDQPQVVDASYTHPLGSDLAIY